MNNNSETQSTVFGFPKKSILLVSIAVIVTTVITVVVPLLLYMFSDITVPSIGTIKTVNVEAYWDRECKITAVTIHWGEIWLEPLVNTTNSELRPLQNVTLYIRSVSNIETSLVLEPANWYPENISDYLILDWNYGGNRITPGETIKVELTLSMKDYGDMVKYIITNDIRAFGVDVIIRALE